jgi:hypothetical protein
MAHPAGRGEGMSTATAPQPDAQIFASRTPNDTIKGFLGTTDTVDAMSPEQVHKIHGLTNEELFPLGERALSDIADDIIVLAEIRQRFYLAKGKPLMGYRNWREFVERNSRYSLRTIQNRLVEVHGKDESKINERYKTEPKVRQHTPEEQPKPVTYQCSDCNGTFEVTTDRIAPHIGTNQKEQPIIWFPPVNPPDIKGWSSMNAGEKLNAARALGCAYCIAHTSARSCPAHGWKEKSHDHSSESVSRIKVDEPTSEPTIVNIKKGMLLRIDGVRKGMLYEVTFFPNSDTPLLKISMMYEGEASDGGQS